MRIGDNELELSNDESSGDHEERSDGMHNTVVKIVAPLIVKNNVVSTLLVASLLAVTRQN